jgi:hypothetical protein
MEQRRDDRSLGQLFADLTRDLSVLVRKEFELARTEVTHGFTSIGRDAAIAGVGGALIYAGFLALMAAVILGLAKAGLDPWIAALLVGLCVVGVGAACVQKGRTGIAQTSIAPKRTVETIRDDAEWAREQMP